MNKELNSDLSERSKRFAVVTICTPSFIPGTMVMIYSFLKWNDWWQGEFVILTDEVHLEMERCLSGFPRVKFKIIGDELLRRSKEVAQADNTGNIFESHFYSLELFNLRDYDKLFYVDSDILVRGSFEPLFELPDKMICVGDAMFYKDELRDGKNYTKHHPKFWEKKSKLWGDNFNAGLILFDRCMATPKHYSDLVAMVHINGYSKQAIRLQDQMIQNIYFRGLYKLVSAKYNFRLGIAEQIKEKDSIELSEAVAIHYTARRKPWLHHEALHRISSEFLYYQAFLYWQEAWKEMLYDRHIEAFNES